MEFCTIIARNYLAFARTLAESIALHHPGAILKVLVIDGDAATERSGPHHEIVTPADIDIAADEFRSMTIIYDVMELATAMKPWLLRWVLDRGASSVVYLDPDMQVFAPLHDLDELARHSIVLTPHRITAVPRDGLLPSETVILQSGVYNLGFIAVGPSAKPFLEWWATRLRRDCVIAHAEGYFVDQRFVDLVPSLFDHYILKDPAFNVAYWNADERSVTRTAQGYEVNGAPLRFFHFSGYRLDDPQHLSKFTAARPRVVLAQETAIAELCRAYGDALVRNALHETAATQYGFARSHGGVELTREIRRTYRDALKEAEAAGRSAYLPDPFDPARNGDFVEWLRSTTKPSGRGSPSNHPTQSNSAREVADLLERGPDLSGKGRFPRAKLRARRYLSRLIRPYEQHQRRVARSLLRAIGESQDATPVLANKVARLERMLARVVEEMTARPYMVDPAAFMTADAHGNRAMGYTTGSRADRAETYIAFEDVFRGTEAFIRDRQRVYVELLSGQDPIIDVGCGRGEMLDLLAANGASVIGVDADQAMVERCRAKGHKVELADAMEFLAGQAESSLGAIFSAQFIEHVDYRGLLRLLELAHRKLKPEGLFIAETVNPHSLPALRTFWVDLTHDKPIFPETLLVLCRGLGFAEARILFPNGTGTLDDDLRTQGEYAVIARRGPTPGGAS